MINGVGPTGTGRIETGRSGGAAKPAATPVRTAGDAGKVANPVAALVASGPPVDSAKVDAIRAAIAEGRYAIDPKAIADKMIALDLSEKA